MSPLLNIAIAFIHPMIHTYHLSSIIVIFPSFLPGLLH